MKDILENCINNPSTNLERFVGDFYKSAMNTERVNEHGLEPIVPLLQRVKQTNTKGDLSRCVGILRRSGVDSFFASYSTADKKKSSTYALYLEQGGLSLPDKECYLSESFSKIRESYENHLVRMFTLSGEGDESNTKKLAKEVMKIETELAKASRSRADLRDEEKNYNKVLSSTLREKFPSINFPTILSILEVPSVDYIVIGQPEFFLALDRIIRESSLQGLQAYLSWRVVHAFAPYLDSKMEHEDFDFFHRILLGQYEPEVRWKLATKAIDELVGEALGKLYVDRQFPPESKRRVSSLIDDIRSVFKARLARLPWMTEETRKQAIAKFERFTVKIGHPDRFREYGSINIDPDDYAGNVKRAMEFEVRRQTTRVGAPVDKGEWLMTHPTVNAYFTPTENQIVFPAGILQPPYFDVTLDDAVNYGAIGAVIAHEITHGYDDQGRRFDAEGNLRDWWAVDDAKEFKTRARAVVELYSAQSPLPGIHVNGELTLGENIADFGGVSLAYEALERRLAEEPSKRQILDGLSPEERFFIAWAQIWRENIREEEMRRRLTIDPHSPMKYRATLPVINHPSFEQAFPLDAKSSKDAIRPKVTIW